MTDEDAKESRNENLEHFLCTKFVSQQLKLASMNIASTEVMLTRRGDEMHFDMFVNIVEGNCSQYDRTLLVLSTCKQKGMNMII